MVYYFLVALYLLICLLLLLVVLLQQGKGGDMASAFGGGGSSQTAFGARAGATVLTRATTVLGALFMLGRDYRSASTGSAGPDSLLSGVKGPGSSRAGAGPAPAPHRRRSSRRNNSPLSRKWRNWQTHQLEGLALARSWGFESPLPHQQLTAFD